MSIYDQPFDPNQSPPGCVCGRHRNPAQHEYEASRMMMCEPAAPPLAKKSCEGVIAATVMRKMSRIV